MQQRNDGSSKKRTLVANKIGAILSSACGIARSRNIALGFGVAAAADEEEAKEKELPLNKTNPCHQIQVHAPTKCITLPCRQRPIEVASAVLTRKWKTSLKRVKLSLKRDDVKARKKTTTKGNDELELCKKRILMGEKCRALNLSGVLHYDNQGILLPED